MFLFTKILSIVVLKFSITVFQFCIDISATRTNQNMCLSWQFTILLVTCHWYKKQTPKVDVTRVQFSFILEIPIWKYFRKCHGNYVSETLRNPWAIRQDSTFWSLSQMLYWVRCEKLLAVQHFIFFLRILQKLSNILHPSRQNWTTEICFFSAKGR